MDYQNFFPNQSTMDKFDNCKREIFTTLFIINVMFILGTFAVWCVERKSTKRIEKLEQNNQTLKKAIFSAMESGLLRNFQVSEDDYFHED